MTGNTTVLLRDLEVTRDETLRFFALSDEGLSRTYGPGKWSVRFLLHHIADAETVLLERIRRMLSEPRQEMRAFDQDAWAEQLDYAQMPLALSRDVYSSCRNVVMYLAERHYESRGHLTFVHSELGERTLREEFEKVAAHNAKHLGHIRAALAQRG